MLLVTAAQHLPCGILFPSSLPVSLSVSGWGPGIPLFLPIAPWCTCILGTLTHIILFYLFRGTYQTQLKPNTGAVAAAGRGREQRAAGGGQERAAGAPARGLERTGGHWCPWEQLGRSQAGLGSKFACEAALTPGSGGTRVAGICIAPPPRSASFIGLDLGGAPR